MSDGDQIVTLKFYDPADSGGVNKRFQGIRSVGIYSGGYLTVSGGNVDLSPLVCEISDGNFQIRVETTTVVNKPVPYADNKPYIVLHWLYAETTSNYMEIQVVNTPATNDVVVGKCHYNSSGVLDGVIYDDILYPRTKPDVQHLFLLVESTGEVERRVRIRGGQIMSTSGVVNIADQKSDLFPAHALRKVHLVYVTSTGDILIDSSGIDSADPEAPNYKGKLVLAEVTIDGDAAQINAYDIRDVRSFLSQNIEPDGITIEKSGTTGKLQVKDQTDYFTAYKNGIQLTNAYVFTKVSLGTQVKRRNITIASDVLTLQAGKKYVLSYSVTMESVLLHPDVYVRWAVVSGDSTWNLENTSNTHLELDTAGDYNPNTFLLLSNTSLIIPNVNTNIRLEAITSATGLTQTGRITFVNVNIVSVL